MSVVGPRQNRHLVRSSPHFDEKPCYHVNSVTVKDSVWNVIEGLFGIGRYNSSALNWKHWGTCYVSYLPLKNYNFFLDERSQKLCVIGTWNFHCWSLIYITRKKISRSKVKYQGHFSRWLCDCFYSKTVQDRKWKVMEEMCVRYWSTFITLGPNVLDQPLWT